MIYFDVTKTSASSHHSGLTRVSQSLVTAFGSRVTPVVWDSWDKQVTQEDWFITAELFSEDERPGITAFLEAKACKTAAIFHDLIPLRFPHMTWPKSVARHPTYVKLLAHFTRVFSVSEYSRQDILAFWKWQGINDFPKMDLLSLGADFNTQERQTHTSQPSEACFLCVGIIEPRKNQSLILQVCKTLWDEGLKFEMHFAGRVNPHFGKPILDEINEASRSYPELHFHAHFSDAQMKALYARASASLFPTRAEGCGLPLLESLYSGVPCICSDLIVLKENTDLGGCLSLKADDLLVWTDAVRSLILEPRRLSELRSQAQSRPLPTWANAAELILTTLNSL